MDAKVVKHHAHEHGGWIEKAITELSAEAGRLQMANAGLQAELAETREALAYHASGETARDLAEACRQLRMADVRTHELVEALQEFGVHTPACERLMEVGGKPCQCGLDEAIAKGGL